MAHPLVSRVSAESPLAEALNREWAHLVDTEQKMVREWADRHASLRACRDLDEVLFCIRRNPDDCLTALLAENHDPVWENINPAPGTVSGELAGRVVLQTMLEEMITMAGRDPTATLDDYVAQLWTVMTSYRVDRRPRLIATNLALETLKAVCRERQDAHIHLTEEHVLRGLRDSRSRVERVDHQAAMTGLTAARVITAAARLGFVDELTRAVLSSIYDDGLSGREAGVRHQLSTDGVRWRCSKAVRRLARHAAELADAA